MLPCPHLCHCPHPPPPPHPLLLPLLPSSYPLSPPHQLSVGAVLPLPQDLLSTGQDLRHRPRPPHLLTPLSPPHQLSVGAILSLPQNLLSTRQDPRLRPHLRHCLPQLLVLRTLGAQLVHVALELAHTPHSENSSNLT